MDSMWFTKNNDLQEVKSLLKKSHKWKLKCNFDRCIVGQTVNFCTEKINHIVGDNIFYCYNSLTLLELGIHTDTFFFNKQWNHDILVWLLETNPSIFQLQSGKKISQNETASVPGNRKHVYLIKRVLIIRSFSAFPVFLQLCRQIEYEFLQFSLSHTYFLKDNCALLYLYIVIFDFLTCFLLCFSQIKYDFKHWEIIYRYSAHIFTIGDFSKFTKSKKRGNKGI